MSTTLAAVKLHPQNHFTKNIFTNLVNILFFNKKIRQNPCWYWVLTARPPTGFSPIFGSFRADFTFFYKKFFVGKKNSPLHLYQFFKTTYQERQRVMAL
jgi:uncharacterized membrane protein YobD (UPF0266 family)